MATNTSKKPRECVTQVLNARGPDPQVVCERWNDLWLEPQVESTALLWMS